MSGAQVRVASETTAWAWDSTADADGYFVAAALPADAYSVTVSQEGFQSYRRTGVIVTLHREARLDIALQLGAVTEQITVEGDAPALNSVDGRIKGEASTREEILSLPLQSRDYSKLAFLTPGTVEKVRGRGSFMSVNGARADQTNFYVDGISNRDVQYGEISVQPNFDAVREFRMETAGYSAEFGRYAGGILQVALRSGTNQFHGAFFEQLRNTAMDSRSFLQRVRNQERSQLNRNQFGAALGGPVLLPGYDGHNRTFFHVSYEGLRQLIGNDATVRVPTELERQGDFSQSNSDLKDPEAPSLCNRMNRASCFPNALIPASRIDPIGSALAALYPLPNAAFPSGQNRFDIANDEMVSDSLVAKIDHQVRTADRLSFRLQRTRSEFLSPGGAFPQWGSLGVQKPTLLGLAYTRTITPSMLFNFQTGLSGSWASNKTIDLGAETAKALGIKVATQDPVFFGMPTVTVTQYANIGPSTLTPWKPRTQDLQWQGGLAWSRGRHDVKWGFGYSRTVYAEPRNTNLRGQYQVTSRFTQDGMGDLLLGALTNSFRRHDPGVSDLIASNFGFYFNDNWRPSNRLTLNFGLRYEINKPFVDRYDRLANFMPSLGKVAIASDRSIPDLAERLRKQSLEDEWVLADEAGLPRSLVRADYTDIAPRFGFAWRPFGDAETVVRAGYGIFYSGYIQGVLRNVMGDAFPVALEERFIAGQQPIPLSNPFPADVTSLPGSGFGAYGVAEKPPTGYLQNWNFTVERDLGRGIVLETAYVGSKGTHLTRWYDLNQPVRNWDTFQLYLRERTYPEPYPAYGALNHLSFGSNSNYHAGQISMRRQAASGLFFRANYTYSKSIDEASSFISDSRMVPYDSKLDRGLSAFDLRHVFNVAGAWDLPFGRARRWLSSVGSLGQGFLGGWRLSGIARVTSGSPLQIVAQGPQLDFGESPRPNRIGSGEQIIQPGRRGWDYPWFRVEDFELVPCANGCKASQYGFQPFQPGNAGRNILEGPRRANLDLALMKDFSLRERHRLQIRAEAFNALNLVNFAMPNTQMPKQNPVVFGKIQGARPPRIMQVSLRYEF